MIITIDAEEASTKPTISPLFFNIILEVLANAIGKGNKPFAEGQKWHDFTCMRYLK